MSNGLRINTNVPALNTARILNRNTSGLNLAVQRLASGYRINSAKDDAAGLAIAEGFRTQVRGTGQAQRNVQDGISLVQTADGVLNETHAILQRVRELAVQSANGTQTTANRETMQNEVVQMLDQIDRIAWETEFNGLKLLSGAQVTTLQAGAYGGQVLYVSTAGAASATIGVSALNISSIVLASSALSTIDIAINSVSRLRAEFGAMNNRLEFTMNTLAVQEENASASESAIRDADIARMSISYSRAMVNVQAGTAMLAQTNFLPQTALQLIG